MTMDRELYKIDYEFVFSKLDRKFYHILLDPETISIVRPEPESLPSWTKLEHQQCKECPLKPTEHLYCPIAVNIFEIVEEFKEMISYTECLVRCTTPERIYLKKTTIMEGLSSIFGIIMATSDCPVMDFFKPMARFHLPFSSVEETTVRVVSMFILQQYFEHGKDGNLNLDMEQLVQQYDRVNSVNEGLFTRIRSLGNKDADKNAIIMLHSLSQILSSDIDYRMESISYLFTPQKQKE
ncbi:DUF6901 family protein [Thermodesulfobacteriota bacterium]